MDLDLDKDFKKVYDTPYFCEIAQNILYWRKTNSVLSEFSHYNICPFMDTVHFFIKVGLVAWELWINDE